MQRETAPRDGADAPSDGGGGSEMTDAPATVAGQTATPPGCCSGFHPKVLSPMQPHRYPSRRMRLLKLSLTTTGTVLFALDTALAALSWPLVLWVAWPTVGTVLAIPMDLRALAYPVLDLLVLYAMGLYRREALVAGWQVLARLPLVVGMGAVITAGLAEALSATNSAIFVRIGGRDQAVGFALALLCFTFCAYVARLALYILLARRVLRRRVLVVGAGQRAWELLHMLSKEGSSLHYDVTFLHHPTLGEVDPRLAGNAGIPIIQLSDFQCCSPRNNWMPTRSWLRRTSGVGWTCGAY